VVRSVLILAAERFKDIPPLTEVLAETESEESIHKYDVRASHRTTISELTSALDRSR
jgi:GTP cyclohydrolase FolE2